MLNGIEAARQYFQVVRQYSLIDRETELNIARRAKNGDTTARKRLITANLRYVVKIALSYRNTGANLMDLIQEGNEGLLEAAKRFDPERGHRLCTYAGYWIRAYILAHIKTEVYGSRGRAGNYYGMLREVSAAEFEKGRAFTVEEIQERLDVTPKVAQTIFRLRNFSTAKLASAGHNNSHDDGDESGLLDRLPDPRPDTEAVVAQWELHHKRFAAIATSLNTVNPRDRKFLEARFIDEIPLAQTAREEGVSREMASRRAKRAVRVIQQFPEVKKYMES